MSDSCPLCGVRNSAEFARDQRRSYQRCEQCRLVFVPPQFWPTAEREQAEYDLHHNSPVDPGYRRFLARVATPLLARLSAGSEVLDFGSGPGPTLSVMLEEAGHSVALFDPFYAPDQAVYTRSYDAITATEVFEHLQRPGAELERLRGLLRPGGILAVMTQMVRDAEAFSRWRYKDDITHICFFCPETFAWIGERFGLEVELISDSVVFLTAPPEHSSARAAIGPPSNKECSASKW